jgi:hypothetical protein
MEEQKPWHRLFGLSWTDFFRGMPVTVEMEKDLSLKKQLLDILIIHKETATLECRLPDGFEELASYNLISFKSHQEKVSAWSLCELIGHYVNLRKQISPSMDEPDLLPPEEFGLSVVSVRYPQQLAGHNVTLKEIKQGVYDIQYFGGHVRLVVVNQLALVEHNSLLHMYSTKAELLCYGAEHYRQRSSETSSLLYELYRRVLKEADTMLDALEEFARETIDRFLKKLPIKKRLEGLSPEQLLEGLSLEQRNALLQILKNQDDLSKPG